MRPIIFLAIAAAITVAEPSHGRAIAQDDSDQKRDAHAPATLKDGDEAESDELSAAETAIIASGTEFVAAFNAADEKAIAEMFAKDAEYINEQGIAIRGRDAIAEAFKASFDANPKAKMQMLIDDIRFVSSGVALEDGLTAVTQPGRREPSYTRYSAVHVLTKGRWLVASVRELKSKEPQHRSRMDEMSWLNGEWVDEGDGTVVLFSCSPVDDGHFLVRKFAIHFGGEAAMTGEQRIGWDPISEKFRSWVFDSAGGFSEGFWYRDENRWELKMHGVTADGQAASSTSIYTLVDDNTMTWQSVDHEVGGLQLPDGDPITIVRRGPPPDTTDEAVSQSK